MKKTILIFFFIFPISVFSQNDFLLNIDKACFISNDSLGYIDIYYAFHSDKMVKQYVNNDTLLTGLLSVRILDINTKKIRVKNKWSFNHILNNDNSNNETNTFIGLIRFELPSGKYSCEIKGQDATDTLKQSIYSFDFVIDNLKENAFSMSDIQIASSIRKSFPKEETMFSKNSYEVIPNPNLTFGKTLPAVFFYTELYDLNSGKDSKKLKLESSVINSFGDTVQKKIKYIPSTISSMVYVDVVNISKNISGIYKINLMICCSDSIGKIEKEKRFFIYNPHIQDTLKIRSNPELLASEFITYNDEQLNTIFDYSRYIASVEELNRWKVLDKLIDKQLFLFHFWKSRDNDPSTEKNSVKTEYFRRIKISNDRYSTLGKKGYATDRGRVMCLYGVPSEIERFPSDVENKPYEKWTYYRVEGGVIFVFADLFGFSEYTLIHSTKKGELRDDNWRLQVRTN